jgi:flagellar hook-basal body complex protein FliE
MSDMNINQVLAQMRTMSIEAGGKSEAVAKTDNSSGSDFAAMLKQSIDTVNQYEQAAGKQKVAFETGQSDVSLAEVMIATQKANVSFQAMLQVRNKLVDAYKDVMSMPL